MRVIEHGRQQRPLFGLLLVAVIGGLGATAPAGILIVEEGVPKATIVKPAAASDVVDCAAAELQRYVRKISGAELPIREAEPEAAGAAIVLAEAKLDPPRHGLECDSFTATREGDRLLLTGNTDRGILYAVYAFLESLGAAWLEPGEEGEFLPRTPTIRVSDVKLAFQPAFDLRGMRIYDQGGGEDTVDWMAKMRMNFTLAPAGGRGDGFPPEGLRKREGHPSRRRTADGLGRRTGPKSPATTTRWIP